MLTESELMEAFDVEELDHSTSYPCVLVLYPTAHGFVRAVSEYLVAEGKTADTAGTGGPAVKTSLTITEMMITAGRWSCIKDITP
jgi:hypothetical protein